MKRRIAPAAAGILLALGTFAALAGAAAPALAAPGVPCSFYGLSPGATLDAATLEDIAAAGAGSVRIELRGGAAGWDDATLAAYDAVVDAARAADLEPVGLLATGVVPGGQAAWNDDADGDGYNPYVEEFATTTAVLVDRFAGRISRWEIWTRPNCWTNPDYLLDPQAAGCTYVLPRVFATMLAEAYRRNRALVDVGAVSFTSGGLLTDDSGPFFSAEDYLNELYAEPAWDALEGDTGRRYPWERVGVQLYVDQLVPTDGALAGSYLDAIAAVAAARADTAFISITEVGWSSMLVGEDIQAENLTTAFELLASRPDIADASWSSYRDQPAADGYVGLVTESGAPKPALAAFQAAAEGCESAGAGGGGGSGGSSSGSGPIGGGSVAGGLGTAPPLGGPRGESSCSCAAAGADRGGRGHAAALLVLVAASAIRTARAGRRRGRRRS